jgi:hypothetical protein
MSTYYEVGKYECRITSQAIGEAKTGTPQFILRFNVLGKVYDDGEMERVNREYERTAYRAITEKTIPYLIEDLKTLGFQGSSFRDLDPGSPNFFDLEGRAVEMWCSHEEGQDGENREKWGVARQGGPKREAPQVKALDAAKLRSLDNLFGKHLKDLAPSGVDFNKRLEKPVPVASRDHTDDGVPF